MSQIAFSSFKAGVVQDEASHFNLTRSVQQTISHIVEAAVNGLKLIAFPECFVPGYPIFLATHTYADSLDMLPMYREACMTANSAQLKAIRKAALDNNIYVALSWSEKDRDALYIAQTLISDVGNVLIHRRKVVPSPLERTIFGQGSGDSLRNVVKTPLGSIGMLLSHEHLHTLLKYHTHSQLEEIHIAAWSMLFTEEAVTAATQLAQHRSTRTARPPQGVVAERPFISPDAIDTEILSASYAIEGNCYVLAAYSSCSSKGILDNTHQERLRQYQEANRPVGTADFAGSFPTIPSYTDTYTDLERPDFRQQHEGDPLASINSPYFSAKRGSAGSTLLPRINGSAAIYNPAGAPLPTNTSSTSLPTFQQPNASFTGQIHAELQLNYLHSREFVTFGRNSHGQRPDLLTLLVDDSPKDTIVSRDTPEPVSELGFNSQSISDTRSAHLSPTLMQVLGLDQPLTVEP